MPNSLSLASGGALVLLVAIAIGLYSFAGETPRDPKVSNAMSAEIEEMRALVKDNGGKEAYAIVSQKSKEFDYSGQHTRAHNFGAALYLEEGVDGLSVCDQQFSFGCFHEFLGRAIADLGIDSVNDLNQRCRDSLGAQSLSCQHGIGHGVQAYFGYDEDHLDKALKVCKDMPFNDPIGGCYGGVFMEYNVRTMWGAQAHARDYHGDPHEPCGKYDQEYQIACYFWQPQWWRQTVAAASSSVSTIEYKRMGAYCAEIPDAAVRLHCYEGIGNVTAQDANFKAEGARKLCDALPNDGARLLCTSLAANHLGIDVNVEMGEAMCKGLMGEAETYCLRHARNQLNIANRVELPYSI